MQELAKHVDWQIDYQRTYIPGFEKYASHEEFTEIEMDKAFKHLCQYDIVYSSYHPDTAAYTMLKVARDRAGTQFIMDCDDDMFAINEDNPFWLKVGDRSVFEMQQMIRDNDWITTTTDMLAERFRERRTDKDADSVIVVPNTISRAYHNPGHDNGEDIIIGFCGGASHYSDLHESGVLDALAMLMHENKRIRFRSVGMIIDRYLPKQRFEHHPGVRGRRFLDELYPTLNFDISIAPILDNQFNKGKSNIKWQEATRMHAAFIGSDIGPYATLEHGKTAHSVENTFDDWYNGLKKLVDDVEYRRSLLKNAEAELEKRWTMEKQWVQYKALFERVVTEGKK